MAFLGNILNVAKQPKLLQEFAAYKLGDGTRKIGSVRIGGFNGFSEYHSTAAFMFPAERRFLETFPFPDGDMIDVGANLGIVSLTLAKRFPSRQIDAFEPNPSTFQSLSANVARNKVKNVKCHELAVSDKAGTVRFDGTKSRAQCSITDADTGILVNTVTIDQLLSTPRRISLLKIDVEGFEEHVLRGAAQGLATKQIGTIYFEVCPANCIANSGADPYGAATLLLSHGYKLLRPLANGGLEPIDPTSFSKVSLENWLAVNQ